MTLFSKVSDIHSITITKHTSDANCVPMLVLKVLHILFQVWHLSAMLPFDNIISLGCIRKLRHREPRELYTINKLVGDSDKSHTQTSCSLVLASSIRTLLTTHFHSRGRSGSRDVDPVNGPKNEKTHLR